MRMADLLTSPASLKLVLSLAHFLWQGCVIALLTLVTARLLGKGERGARVRYGIVMVGLFAMVFCLITTYMCIELSPAESFGKNPPREASHNLASGRATSIHSGTNDSLSLVSRNRQPLPQTGTELQPVKPGAMQPAVLIDPDTETSSEHPSTEMNVSVRKGTVITWLLSSDRWWTHFKWRQFAPHALAFYFLGVLAMFGRLLLGLRGGQRLKQVSLPVEDTFLLDALARQARAMSLRFIPAIAYCHRTVVPTVVGIFHPSILLPLSFTTGLSPEQVEMILAHELAHIRRLDPLFNLCQRLIESVLFFHPAVWYLSHRARLERELCCDTLVLQAGGERLTYASTLVELAGRTLLEASSRCRTTAAVEGQNATGRPSQLRDRIKHLLGDRGHERMTARRPWLLGAAMAICLLAPTLLSLKMTADNRKIEEQPKERLQWIATLEDGVEVELVGLTEHPSSGKTWWKPDGTILEEAPYESLSFDLPSTRENHQVYELAFRIQNLPDYPFFAFVSMGRGGKRLGLDEDSSDPNIWAYAVDLYQGEQEKKGLARFDFHVTTGPWKTKETSRLGVMGVQGFLGQGIVNRDHQNPREDVIFAGWSQIGGDVVIDTVDVLQGRDFRLEILDKDGAIHLPIAQESFDTKEKRFKKLHSGEAELKDLVLANVETIIVQTRRSKDDLWTETLQTHGKELAHTFFRWDTENTISEDKLNVVALTPMVEHQDGFRVHVTHTLDPKQVRVKVIDRKGEARVIDSLGGLISNTDIPKAIRVSSTRFAHLKVDRIEAVRFQTRAFREVQFRDISLRTGQKTTAGIYAQKITKNDASGISYTFEKQAPKKIKDLDIRLIGIRANGDDAIYGMDGKKIKDSPAYSRNAAWKIDELQRNFLFEIPPSPEPIQFLRPVIIKDSGSKALWSNLAFFPEPILKPDGSRVLTLQSTLPKERHDSVGFGFARFPKTRTLNHVDITLRYYQGPRGKADAMFRGPFQSRETYTDKSKRFTLSIKVSHPGLPLQFAIQVDDTYTRNTPAVVYDRWGKAHLAGHAGGSFSSGGSAGTSRSNCGFRVNNLALADVSRISFNEKPHEIVFRDIPVFFAGLANRTCPLHLEEVAKRLGTSTNPEELRQHKFVDFSEAMDVMEVTRDTGIIVAIAESFRKEKLKTRLQDMDQVKRKRFVEAIDTWAKAEEPLVRAAGLRMGISMQPERYIPLAISELLQREQPSEGVFANSLNYDRSSLANALANARTDLTGEQMNQIASLLIDQYDTRTFSDLLRCIAWNYQNPDSMEALEHLVESDKPWLWPQVIQGHSASLLKLRDTRGLSNKVKKRAAALGLKKGVWYPDLEITEEEAMDILASALTPQHLQISLSSFSETLKAAASRPGPERFTPILLDFLKELDVEWSRWQVQGRASYSSSGVDRCVKYLNLWHKIDIGGLGENPTQETQNDHSYDWRAITREAIAWSETGLDPGKLSKGWTPGKNDLRIIWKNLKQPELSVISVWEGHLSEHPSPTWRPLEMVHDFFNVRIIADQTEQRIEMKTGIKMQHSNPSEVTVDRTLESSTSLHIKEFSGSEGVYSDGTRVKDKTWLGPWEVWLEPAAAHKSVLERTQLFTSWSENYLAPGGTTAPLPVTTKNHSRERLRDYLLSLRDYSGWSPCEIALREAMDEDSVAWDIRPVAKQVERDAKRRTAIASWENFLTREDLTLEMQIYAWKKIGFHFYALHVPGKPHFHKADAFQAFEKVLSIDPEYVCGDTIQTAYFLGSFVNMSIPGKSPLARVQKVLDCREWLRTRTDDMITRSVRRPRPFNFGNSIYPLRTVRNDSEEGLLRIEHNVKNQLKRELESFDRMLKGRLDSLRREAPAAADYLER